MDNITAFKIFEAIIKEVTLTSFFDTDLTPFPSSQSMATKLPRYTGNQIPYLLSHHEHPDLYKTHLHVFIDEKFKVGVVVGTDLVWLTSKDTLCVVNVLTVARTQRLSLLHKESLNHQPILKAHLERLQAQVKLGEMVGIIKRYSTKEEYERLSI